MWTAIATSLNAIGNGAQKQSKEWQKVLMEGFILYYMIRITFI